MDYDEATRRRTAMIQVANKEARKLRKKKFGLLTLLGGS